MAKTSVTRVRSTIPTALAMLRDGTPREEVARWLLIRSHLEAGVPLPTAPLVPVPRPRRSA